MLAEAGCAAFVRATEVSTQMTQEPPRHVKRARHGVKSECRVRGRPVAVRTTGHAANTRKVAVRREGIRTILALAVRSDGQMSCISPDGHRHSTELVARPAANNRCAVACRLPVVEARL